MKLLSVTLGFSIVLTSCLCTESVTSDNFKTEKVYSFMPLINDSVVFVNNAGSRHVYNKTASINEHFDEDCGECCTRKSENRRIRYDGSDVSFNIEFLAFANETNDYLNVSYESKNELNVFYHNQKINYLDKARIYPIIDKYDPQVIYLDSIKILNKRFFNVFVLSKSVVSEKWYPSELYYNNELGMIGYMINDGKIYEIVD